jgi:hypothetical protein
MASYELTITAPFEATTAQSAERTKAVVQDLLNQPAVKMMLMAKGVKLSGSIKVGDVREKK